MKSEANSGQSQQRSEPGIRLIFWLVVGLIAYGSIFPFDFQSPAAGTAPWRVLIDSATTLSHRGDIIGNIALFLPLGFVGVFGGHPSPLAIRLGKLLAISIGLSVGLQLVQIYLPSRDANLQDALWNLLGTAIGAVAAIPLVGQSRLARRISPFATIPLLIIASWLCYRLFPFIPSLDWQQFKDSIKPLVLKPDLTFVGVYHDTIAWCLVIGLWASLQFRYLTERYVLLLIPAVFAAEIVIVMNRLSLSNVVGAIGGVLLWWILCKRLTHWPILLAVLLTGVLVVQGLAPFELRPHAAPFHWIPFYGFLGGSMLINTAVVFEKFFLYGGLIWLLDRSGLALPKAAALVVIVMGVIEYAQTHFSAHTPEITDPVLVILIAAFLGAIESRLMQPFQTRERNQGTA